MIEKLWLQLFMVILMYYNHNLDHNKPIFHERVKSEDSVFACLNSLIVYCFIMVLLSLQSKLLRKDQQKHDASLGAGSCPLARFCLSCNKYFHKLLSVYTTKSPYKQA